MSIYGSAVSLLGASLGLLFLGLAWWVRQRWDEPGVRWFSAVLALFGLGIAGEVVLLALARLTGAFETGLAVLSLSTVTTFFAAGICFLLFALEYTGRAGPFSRELGAGLGGLIMLTTLDTWQESVLGLDLQSTFLQVLLGITRITGNLLALFAASIGVFFVIVTTREYGHLSTASGGLLGIGVFSPYLSLLVLSATPVSLSTSGILFGLSAGYAVTAACFGLAVTQFSLFESTPAVGEVGRKRFVAETDSHVLVTDHRERLIDINDTATRTLDVQEGDHLGNPVAELLEHSVGKLRAMDTLELDTADGRRQYHPQLSATTDQHGRQLGHLITLTDITERRIREQRLEVLNRVLRHNLRNDLTHVRGRMEMVADSLEDEELAAHLDSAMDTTDELLALGDQAREVGDLMDSERDDRETVDLGGVVTDAVDKIRTRYPDARVSVSLPDDVQLRLVRGLLYYIVYNLVENGAVHNDSESVYVDVLATVDQGADYPVTIEVADNGPGIPEHEREAIDAGHESALEHGSGLGLWITNWSVTQFGGQLSFETGEDGTTALVKLPQTPVREETGTQPAGSTATNAGDTD